MTERGSGGLDEAFGVELEPELLTRSLTHRSFAYENGGLPTNERLEFLGDAVLSVVITTALYDAYPDLPEGQLAKLRASVVNMRALADVARTVGDVGIGPHILLGRGEETTGGRDKASILADTLEALLGAIYVQHGLTKATSVILALFAPVMADVAERGAGLDWKTSLQELTAALNIGVPEYAITEAGPDHAKTFSAAAIVGGEQLALGEGRSKKEAEQRAAGQAWELLNMREKSRAQGSDESVRLTIWVHGKVQRVGFRWFVRSRALELGLVGWATNLPDGRVEVIVEGPEKMCRELLSALSGSDAPGMVSRVVERMTHPKGDLTGFTIR